MANWTITENEIGVQPIEDSSTTQRHSLGKIVRARHETYGNGEFIYLKGLASTAVGDLVNYDQLLGVTARGPLTGGVGPVAVAMSANVANQWGWYQISGAAVVKASEAMTVGSMVYSDGTNLAEVDDAGVAGEQIVGARVSASLTPAAGFGVIQINRPFHQGATT